MEYEPEAEVAQHLRLTLETDREGRVTVLEARPIDEPLRGLDVVVGPFIYDVRAEGKSIWTQTLPDPFIAHGRMLDDRGHSVEVLNQATFVIRVPMPTEELAREYEIRLLRANTELPKDVPELQKLIEAEAVDDIETVGSLDSATIREHLESG